MQAIATQLTALGIEFTRIAAVDGHHLTTPQLAALNEESYKRKHGMTPIKGKIGCYLSHLDAIQAFTQSTADFALILEDDIILTSKVTAALAGLTAYADRWDMVKLSAIHSGTPQPYLEIAPKQWLRVMLSRCTGSSAYLINRKAATAYLAKLLPMELPYDQVFDQGWHLGIKVRLLTPVPCVHNNDAPTTIVSAIPSRKFHWSQRTPMLVYRLKNEFRRVAYGIAELIREKLHKQHT